MSLHLTERFLDAAPPAQVDPDREALAERLLALWQAGKAKWSGVDLSPEDYASHLGGLAKGEPLAWLSSVRGDELFLACACARGNHEAIHAFDRAVMTEIREMLGRVVPERAMAEEVAQVVVQQLLAPSANGSPGIAQYAGEGKLRGWVRVIAVREALRVRRRGAVEIPSAEAALEAVGEGADPELRYMKELYRSEFREAFAEALAALSARERTLLRYAVIDGLSVDQIGTIYRVHRASAARWVAGAREQLAKCTRSALMRRLGVGAREQESILRFIESELDLSVRRYLDEAG